MTSNRGLETAKDVSFLLLSNLLIVFLLIFIIISAVYYATIGRNKDNKTSFTEYVKGQFEFNYKLPSISKEKIDETKSKLGSYIPNINLAFGDVYMNYFKYPSILFAMSILFMVLFRLPDKHSFHKTAEYSVPILFILFCFFLYKSYSTDYVDYNNYNLNRMKSLSIFITVMMTLATFYQFDPGNYIKNNFNESMLLIILFGFAVFIKMMIVLFVNRMNPLSIAAKRKFDSETRSSKLFNLASYTLYFVFLVGMVIAINLADPNTDERFGLKVATSVVGFVWGTYNIYRFFNNQIRPPTAKNKFMGPISKGLSLIFAISILAIIIKWLISYFDDFGGKLSTFGSICSIIIISILLATIYKFIKNKYQLNDTRVDYLFNIFIEILFYIPCLLNNIFDFIYRFFLFLLSNEQKEFYFFKQSDKVSIGIILIILGLVVGYMSVQKGNNQLMTQGGEVMVNNPIYLNKEYYLGTFETLNPNSDYKYNYSISFWIYLHSNPSNNSDQFYKILSYANKPSFLYNPKQHIFKITSDISGGETPDEIYINKEMDYQKWTNIIMNVNDGITDIFLNNTLVASKSGAIPFYSIDALMTGENGGISGGICNVLYFDKPLTFGKMFILYNSAKMKNRPVSDISGETVIKSI